MNHKPSPNPHDWFVLFLAFFFLAAVFLASADSADWEHDAKRICEALGVPYEIARAIIQTESAGNPYVLNVKIGTTWQSYALPTIETAAVLLNQVMQHTDWVDIGLMQVHWRIHRRTYDVQPVDLLDIDTNLNVGCDILKRSLDGSGPLWQRIGRYHSATPARNQDYARKVLTHAVNSPDPSDSGSRPLP